ncbi:MAG TPA: maleylpyruvate isomerase N-terminal domain-containing protein [Actinomycetota bacterium]|nr:maleylpyruvate isomerase N-terminal domain-containing protein [Actinomycetota bacterium]
MSTAEELLTLEDEAWSRFRDAFASVPEPRRDDPTGDSGWSVKDLVWHCAYWADYVGTVLEHLTQGMPVPVDQDWDGMNAAIARESQTMGWDEVIVGARRGRDRARAALLAMPEVTEDAEREFAGETFEHYDEHAAEIERFAATLDQAAE